MTQQCHSLLCLRVHESIVGLTVSGWEGSSPSFGASHRRLLADNTELMLRLLSCRAVKDGGTSLVLEESCANLGLVSLCNGVNQPGRPELDTTQMIVGYIDLNLTVIVVQKVSSHHHIVVTV